MKNLLRPFALALCLLGFIVVPCRADPPVNVDGNGLAIQGYDPVGYAIDNKPVKGDGNFQSVYQGGTYRFASAEHKALFDKEPAKYAPQFGGFCAYGVSQGHTVASDPTVFEIVDGRLLLQYGGGARDAFNHDQAGNLKKADVNWSGIVEKKAK